MFKIDEEHTYSWPVTVKKPVDGGKFESETLDVTFRALDIDRVTELTRGAKDDRVLMREAVLDLVACDKSGKRLPFDKALLEKMLKVPFVLVAMRDAYFASVNGAGQKN